METCPHGLPTCAFFGLCPEGIGCQHRDSLVIRGRANAKAERDAMEAQEAAARLGEGDHLDDTDPEPVSLALDNDRADALWEDRWNAALLGWLTFCAIVMAISGAWWWFPIAFAVAILNAHLIRARTANQHHGT